VILNMCHLGLQHSLEGGNSSRNFYENMAFQTKLTKCYEISSGNIYLTLSMHKTVIPGWPKYIFSFI
jgi:hypothetical protein